MGSVLPALCVRKGASKAEHPAVAARELAQTILQPDAALYLFYCAPGYDLTALGEVLFTGVSIAGDVRVASTHIDDLKHFELANQTFPGVALGSVARASAA